MLAVRAALAQWARLACLGALLAAVAACSNVPSPQPIPALADSAIPDHAAFATLSCLKCHEFDRPPAALDVATGARLVHGGGADCGQCHAAGGPTWTSFTAFNHVPTPASCLDCHETARPKALVNQMSHTYPGVGDCVACHAAGAGVSWTTATFTHQPLPGTCVECHSAQRPSGVVNGFSHAAGGMGDCVSCHHSPGVAWSDGFFSHSPAPARCVDCHAATRPVGPVGTPPFDHAKGGTGDCKSCHAPLSATQRDWSGGSFSHSPVPATCIDCHLSTRPIGPAGTPPFDHAKGGTGDCKSCHAPKSATQTDWSGGNFSHSPAPAACLDCHVGDRPAGPVGSPAFDHAVAGMGDCKSCHAPKSATKTDWSGGSFSHSPAPATCIGCHLAQRPATVTSTGFDHAKGGTGDCVACHQNPGVTWKGAIAGYDHGTMPAGTRCDSCHLAKQPAAPVAVAWPGHPGNPNLFLHAVVAGTDCKGCHLDPGGAWAPGAYAHSPDPGQCSVCHLNQRPVGPAGSPLFDHALGGAGDCAACHAVKSPTKTDWTGGNFTHTSAITACAGCHEYRRPADALHTTQGTGDCISCHAMKSATQTDWTGGTFSHVPKPTTCAGCHAAQKPAAAVRTAGTSTDGRTYQNDYLHGLVSGDCVTCHAVKSATQVDWTGGRYSHSPVPATCTSCHAVTRPAAGATSFDHSQPGLADCKSCHSYPGQKWTGASAVPAYVTLTPPTGKAAWGNITAPHPFIDTAKAGLTCATCHGTNTSAKIIAYDHAYPVSGSQCVYCHYTGQTETSASVETKNHQSTSNTKDCTTSGCHKPKYPTWNATQKKFTGGSWGSP